MSEKDPIRALQQRINAVRTTLWETAQRDELEELVHLVHAPGWSASERALVSASLDQLQALARMITLLRSELVRVATQVARPPDPETRGEATRPRPVDPIEPRRSYAPPEGGKRSTKTT